MHPEASFQEFRTTDKVAAALDELGVSYRRLEPTGLIAEIGKPGKTVALRADMDALSIQEQTGCAFKSVNDGFMHACGHDAHTAMLLGAVKVLNSMKNELPGTVRFLFQPAEEVGKGAKAVVAQGGMEGVDAAFGIHCSVQTPVGALQCHPGGIAAAADRFKITVKGKACHGAYPQTGMDATVCASAMILNLQTMVSREFSPMDTLVVTVGSIHSGSRFNIVSGEAVMEGAPSVPLPGSPRTDPRGSQEYLEETAKTFRCTAEVESDVLTDVLVDVENMVELGFEAAPAKSPTLSWSPTTALPSVQRISANIPSMHPALSSGWAWAASGQATATIMRSTKRRWKSASHSMPRLRWTHWDLTK